MSVGVFAAVDLGASGGRVMAGSVGPRRLTLEVVHRFPNSPVESPDHLRWDMDRLYSEVQTGLALIPDPASIGIDTWGVDYGLLDGSGELLADPICYRDARTAEVIDQVHAKIPPAELFAINGLQFLPFTTIYQLAAEQHGHLWEKADRIALLPDLIAHRLTGRLCAETTNASTTGLLDARTGAWSREILDRCGIPAAYLPELEPPGQIRGTTLDGIPVTSVGSHDTASAVVAVPATTDDFAYVASGTWSLVGIETAGPVLAEAARMANFTNERGVDGRNRFLRNVGGMWLIQESMRTWGRQDLEALLAEAAALPAGGPTVNVDDPEFVRRGGMPDRIARAAGASSLTPAATVRCVVDSLAAAYARTIRRAAELTGRDIRVVHVVGGGSQNELLCQLTADAVGLRVLAGPVEATAIGNVVVQARAHGALTGSLEGIRSLIASAVTLRQYQPSNRIRRS